MFGPIRQVGANYSKWMYLRGLGFFCCTVDEATQGEVDVGRDGQMVEVCS